ncbi:MAG TPA: hypothetical protein VHS81_12760 [Caulobacteraceae bacterium]|nr:hypothetical protein [Caulobacteraceae bacterium]
MHRRAFAAALAATALAAPWRAGASTRIALADAFLLLPDYLALKPAQRDRFQLAYRAVRNGKAAPDVKARILHRDHSQTPLAIDADGWVTELPTLEQLKGHDDFEADGPDFDMALELRATLAPADRLPVAELTATLAQVNAAMVIFGGGDPSAVGRNLDCVYFPDAGAGRAILEGGAERPLPVFDFKLIGPTPYFEPRAMPKATAVALAKTPSRIVMAGPPRR